MPSGFVATDPSGYEVFMGRWSRRLAHPFLEFAGIKSGNQVLDVGCGTGIMSFAAAERGATVMGVDLSQAYLKFAEDYSAHPNITYELGDARSIRHEPASFDVAISSLVLDVVPYAKDIVCEMRRVVHSGGVVASVLQEKRSAFTPVSLLLDIAAVFDSAARALRDEIMAHPLIWVNGQAELWRQIGLTDVEEVPLVIPYEYASFDDYWATFLTGQGLAGNYVMSLTEEARSDLRKQVSVAYLAGMLDGPRTFSVIHRAVRGLVVW